MQSEQSHHKAQADDCQGQGEVLEFATRVREYAFRESGDQFVEKILSFETRYDLIECALR